MRKRCPAAAWRPRLAAWLLLILPLMAATGCADRSTGLELAKAGNSTANILAAFYESLIQDRLDTLEIAVFINALDGGTVDETLRLQDLAWKEVNALQHRVQLAHQMASTYNALKNLSSYDASGEVKEAVQGLVGQLLKTPVLRGPVDPSGLLGSLAGEVAAWRQTRDIHKGVELLQGTFEKFVMVFEREKPAYKSIAKERTDEIVRVYHRILTTQGGLQVWPQVREMVDWLNLPTSVRDSQTAEAYRQLAQVRVRRLWLLSENAADSTGQALSQLVDSQRTFIDRRGANLSQVLVLMQKAKAYLDEIAKIRAQKR